MGNKSISKKSTTFQTCLNLKNTSKKRPNQLERDICYVQPQNPWLKLTLCTYGHRDDRALQYDVTEKLQERVDTQFDGRYLGVPKDENLVKMFGDPYPGTPALSTIEL